MRSFLFPPEFSLRIYIRILIDSTLRILERCRETFHISFAADFSSKIRIAPVCRHERTRRDTLMRFPACFCQAFTSRHSIHDLRIEWSANDVCPTSDTHRAARCKGRVRRAGSFPLTRRDCSFRAIPSFSQ